MSERIVITYFKLNEKERIKNSPYEADFNPEINTGSQPDNDIADVNEPYGTAQEAPEPIQDDKEAANKKAPKKAGCSGGAGCVFAVISMLMGFAAFCSLMANLSSNLNRWDVTGIFAAVAVVSFLIAGLLDRKK